MHGSHVFMIARVLILLSLAAQLSTASLDIQFQFHYNCALYICYYYYPFSNNFYNHNKGLMGLAISYNLTLYTMYTIET